MLDHGKQNVQEKLAVASLESTAGTRHTSVQAHKLCLLAVSLSASVGHSPLVVGDFIGGRHEHLKNQYPLATLQCRTHGSLDRGHISSQQTEEMLTLLHSKDLRRYCFCSENRMKH